MGHGVPRVTFYLRRLRDSLPARVSLAALPSIIKYVITPELYATKYRAVGLGSASVWTRVGGESLFCLRWGDGQPCGSCVVTICSGFCFVVP